ncbi:hypothetical protein BO79DRAFT_215908 [Aspergillus costaricaensis CBS 115574]|uniref:Uncharacterized protein n=1 Tax=Aspergillus costaricaensis CBS 115574 TaxID=1448317 RepID=A0ACD1IMG5_9EURO|nr:hypothetical protein BO79DRAFT_215908 [Aspergillus costaricaensis CBS 115574]RAK90911.1 hypothetical protein BO79DRAFT_215908 [Aspergillus costaricaensis CBS 115574]
MYLPRMSMTVQQLSKEHRLDYRDVVNRVSSSAERDVHWEHAETGFGMKPCRLSFATSLSLVRQEDVEEMADGTPLVRFIDPAGGYWNSRLYFLVEFEQQIDSHVSVSLSMSQLAAVNGPMTPSLQQRGFTHMSLEQVSTPSGPNTSSFQALICSEVQKDAKAPQKPGSPPTAVRWPYLGVPAGGGGGPRTKGPLVVGAAKTLVKVTVSPRTMAVHTRSHMRRQRLRNCQTDPQQVTAFINAQFDLMVLCSDCLARY